MAVRQPDFIIKAGQADGGGGLAKPIEEVPQGPRNGVNRTFTLSHTPAAGYPILLFLNGVYQNRFIVEYTQTGAQITYTSAPLASDSGHVIVYWIGAGGIIGTLRARSFAGSGETVNYGTNATAWNLQDMSCGIWINLPSNAQGCIIGYLYGGTALADNSAFGLGVAGSAGSWNIEYGHDHGSSGSTDQDHEFVTAIPNDVWVYIGFTRDTTAKTVTFYMGDGSTVRLIETYTYTTNHDGGTSSVVEMRVGNTPGTHGGSFTDYVGSAQQHYVTTAKWTMADHASAMNGSPPATGLVLNSAMGQNPEVDISPTGASGAVTGTTLVQGHS